MSASLVGSEMCIRDSPQLVGPQPATCAVPSVQHFSGKFDHVWIRTVRRMEHRAELPHACWR
eukprot:2404072-Alexandrium_andersonii.AAC.1